MPLLFHVTKKSHHPVYHTIQKNWMHQKREKKMAGLRFYNTNITTESIEAIDAEMLGDRVIYLN